LIGAVLTLIAIQLLPRVREAGEVNKSIVKRIMRTSLRSNLRDFFVIDIILNWQSALTDMLKGKRDRGDRLTEPDQYPQG
jgi:hypothetical protein